MTLKESFEPIVMFFGLTNSLAMFYIMMNEILWDLINTREVASFIDDVIVDIDILEKIKIAREKNEEVVRVE